MRRGNQDFSGTGLSVGVGVLAGMVDIEPVVGMFQGRHSESAFHQGWNQACHHMGLPAARPTGQTEDARRGPWDGP